MMHCHCLVKIRIVGALISLILKICPSPLPYQLIPHVTTVILEVIWTIHPRILCRVRCCVSVLNSGRENNKGQRSDSPQFIANSEAAPSQRDTLRHHLNILMSPTEKFLPVKCLNARSLLFTFHY